MTMTTPVQAVPHLMVVALQAGPHPHLHLHPHQQAGKPAEKEAEKARANNAVTQCPAPTTTTRSTTAALGILGVPTTPILTGTIPSTPLRLQLS
jgi:hypothetical protein